MRIRYLPANQCWVLMFHDQIVEMDGTRFWNHKRELLRFLISQGLTVKRGGWVVAKGAVK